MNTFKPIFFSVILLVLSHHARSELIAFDLNPSGHQNLISYQNDLQAGFSSSGDYFQAFAGIDAELLPASLLDRSASTASDSLGLVASGEGLVNVFGISDTVNTENRSDWAVANWVFNISGFSQLSVVADFAAMGDFEASDKFEMTYSLDANSSASLFTILADTSTSTSYPLASGSVITLNDPLVVDDTILTNQFSRHTKDILGQGDYLNISLKAKADGGTEVFAMRNLQIFGEKQATVTEVPEPRSKEIMLMASLILLGRQLSIRRR